MTRSIKIPEVQRLLCKLLETIQKLEANAGDQPTAHELDTELNNLLEEGSNSGALLQRLKALEEKFAKKYPGAAQVLGEIIEAIARAGT